MYLRLLHDSHLSAMPGKQMAIDADLNTGAIDDAEAKDAVKRFRMNLLSLVPWMVLQKVC